jgi:hypothetical protein
VLLLSLVVYDIYKTKKVSWATLVGLAWFFVNNTILVLSETSGWGLVIIEKMRH